MTLPGPLGDPLAIGVLFQVFAQATPVTTIALADPKPRSQDSVVAYFPTIVNDPFLGKTTLDFKDVNQGQVANCPVTAVLAAMARTKPNDLKGMIAKITGQAYTYTPQFQAPPAPPSFSHFFKVTFPGSSPIVVSPLLYKVPRPAQSTDPAEIMYAHSPGSPSVASWVSLMEKAYVIKKDSNPKPQDKSYDALDNRGKGLNPLDVMNDIAGSGAEYVVDPKESNATVVHPWTAAELQKVLARATTVPTIAASRSDQKDIGTLPILTHHDYAVVGMTQGKVQLYNCHELPDSDKTKNPALTITEFMKAFLMVVMKP